jgi:hypothetical protein
MSIAFMKFGEDVPGYDVPVLKERAVPASATSSTDQSTALKT